MSAVLYPYARYVLRPSMTRLEFFAVYSRVIGVWYSLPPTMRNEFQTFRDRLHGDLAAWQSGQPLPDWCGYAHQLNCLCLTHLHVDLFADGAQPDEGAIDSSNRRRIHKRLY